MLPMCELLWNNHSGRIIFDARYRRESHNALFTLKLNWLAIEQKSGHCCSAFQPISSIFFIKYDSGKENVIEGARTVLGN